MSEGLGNGIGNGVELKEGMGRLKGNGGKEVREVVLRVGCEMVVLGEEGRCLDEGGEMVMDGIKRGKGLKKLKRFVWNEGGDECIVDCGEKLGRGKYEVEFKGKKDGYISEIIGNEIGVG